MNPNDILGFPGIRRVLQHVWDDPRLSCANAPRSAALQSLSWFRRLRPGLHLERSKARNQRWAKTFHENTAPGTLESRPLFRAIAVPYHHTFVVY